MPYVYVADPSPESQPKPPDYTWVLILVIGYFLLSGGSIGGGAKAPTKNIPDVPSVFTLFDDDPKAVQELDKAHPGQADVMASIADDSIRLWTTKTQGGKWLLYGTKGPAPDPDPKFAGPWAKEAYDLAKAAGKLPWTIAAGPNGKGFSGPTPDGQKAADSLKVIGK